jgi:transposase InsO family protein
MFPVHEQAIVKVRMGKVTRGKTPEKASHLQEEYELTTVDLADLRLAVEEQYKDGPSRVIINYLAKREIPQEFDPPARARLVRRAASFALLDTNADKLGLFYYPASPRPGFSNIVQLPPRFVVPPTFRPHILGLFHSSPFGGHSGITRTLRKISARYYWDCLYEDVVTFVKSCVSCQRAKAEHHVAPQPTSRIPDPTEPWQVVSIDFAGPFEQCEEFWHILLFVDHFTQYCIGIPTQNTTSGTVMRAFITEVVCRYGMPRHVLTDRGSGFNNAAFSDLSKLLGVQLHMTSARHPQSNGKTERFVGSVKQTITASTHEAECAHWVDALPPAIFALNTTPSTVTGLSPYFLNHGRHPVLPGDVLDAAIEEGAMEDSPVDAYALALANEVQIGLSQVRLMQSNREEQTRIANEAIPRVTTFSEGDDVWLKDHRSDSRIGSRGLPAFAYPFTGPFRILKRIGPVTYIIRGYKNGEPIGTQRTVHAIRLRPYKGASPQEQKLTTPEADTANPSDVAQPSPSASISATAAASPAPSAHDENEPDTTMRDSSPAATVRSRHAGRYRPNYTEIANTKTPVGVKRPEARYSHPHKDMPPRKRKR